MPMTSYCSAFSRITNGSRMSCWWTLFGKYSSMVRPLRRNRPVPGTTRTRTMASLRRPRAAAARRSGAAAAGCGRARAAAGRWPPCAGRRSGRGARRRRSRSGPRSWAWSLGHLLDLVGLGLLRGVRVLGARVHLQLLGHLPAEAVVRQHALHGPLDDAVGVRADLVTDVDRPQTTRVAGVPVGDLLVPLGTGQRDLARVHDDDEVTAAPAPREPGPSLAAQQDRDLAGKSTEHHVGGVDDVPDPVDLAGLG